MPILNYTTEVPFEKSIGEISQLLARKGARSIQTDYNDKGTPVGLAFVMAVGGIPVRFQLPNRSEGVAAAILKDKPHNSNHRVSRAAYEQRIREQAERVSWRIVKDWVEAQLALIESGQAEMGQVFMPYATAQDGRTMYELFLENNQKQLGSGGGDV